MTPKYYTPTIEEFHIGFEFEQNENEVWKKCTLQDFECEMLFAMLTCYPDEKWRVKHLDSEDILECGWILANSAFGRYCLNDKYYLSYSDDGFINIGYDKGFQTWITLCITPCKNKSELKKLMLQLGIN